MEEALWTPAQTAKHLSISTKTLDKISGVELPCIWIRGQRRFDPEEVRLYKKRQMRGPSLKSAEVAQ